MQAQALGLPTLTARTESVSREEKAWQSLAAKTDPIMGTRIRQERELNRAVTTATNAAVGGYASQEQALQALTLLEQKHIAELHTIEAANDQAALAAGRRVKADRMAALTRQNLIFQGQDIAVQLAGGQNPALVLMQQGPQILSGPGGLNGALKEAGNLAGMVVTKFGLVGAAIGAGALAIEGLRRHIVDTTGVAVSFGDVAMGVFQVIGSGIMSALSPALNWVADVFGGLWNAIAPPLKQAGNGIIGVFVGAYEATKDAWGNLPTYFSALGKEAWNSFISTFENPALTINGMTIIPGLDLSGMKAALSDAEKASFGKSSVTFGDAMSQDYLGDFGDAVSDQAIKNYKAGLEATEKAAGKVTKAAKEMGGALSDAAKAAKAEWDFYRGTFSGFFSDLKTGLSDGKGFWESFGNAAAGALDKIAGRLLGMASDGLFDMLFGSLFGGGWNIPSTFQPNGFYPAFPSANGNVFQSQGLHSYANTIVNRPTVFPFAKGIGLMGEAGPEAIMPLRRTAGGRLGVEVAGGGSGSVTIQNNINGSGLSQEQLAAALAKANRETLDHINSRLPDAIQDVQRNPRVRGKGYF
jgi:phage-related minor tail protein